MRKIIKGCLVLFIVVIFIFVSTGVYITFIERNLLVTKTKDIVLTEGKDNLKVVQFTDTQLGEYYTIKQLEKAVDKINSLEPDIVVFTGDLIDHAENYEDLYKVSGVLSKIKSNLGNFAVYGNHDYGGGGEHYYEDIMAEAGFTVLSNESTSVTFKGKTINIFGGDEALIGNHDPKETMKNIKEEDINLLLIHEPDLAEEYANYPIDFIFSGHSHGGQVYIPFYGPIKKNLLSEKYNKGLYDLNNERGTRLYVSSGLGNTKVPFRFLNVPEILLFNLKL